MLPKPVKRNKKVRSMKDLSEPKNIQRKE